ncbi:MAG: GNAT family N-acetyltransferase [Bacteroidia bacterium]
MSEISSEYKVVRANEDNIHLLAWMFKDSKGVDISLDYLKKKFNSAYAGCTYLGHFAIDNTDKPAAFFCLHPCFIQINGEVFKAAQGGDIITHHNHQRKGLFGMLGRITEQVAIEEGVTQLFGFPNENSYPGFVRTLGWQPAGKLINFSQKVKAFPLRRLLFKLRLPFLYSFYVKILTGGRLIKPEDFIGSVPAVSGNSSYRNSDFYKYKVSYNSSFFLAYGGLKLWLKIDGALRVGDITPDETVSPSALIDILRKLTRKLGLEEFTFRVSEGSFWHSKLKGLLQEDDGISIIYSNLNNKDQCVFLEFTAGDADVF